MCTRKRIMAVPKYVYASMTLKIAPHFTAAPFSPRMDSFEALNSGFWMATIIFVTQAYFIVASTDWSVCDVA